MTVDAPTPLATAEDLQQGAFADLARSFTSDYLDRVMIRATRTCENKANRRLAPFTLTETQRGRGVDPDEFTDAANLPLDLVGTVGRSFAYALGTSTLVRHVWLNEFAARYPELWTFHDVTVTVIRSYGGSEIMTVTDFEGPEIDSGHLWFSLGKFVPVGSLIRVRYSGGYTVSIPADLEQSCIYMAAGMLCRELDPMARPGHSPDALEALAVDWLHPYMRA